MAASASVAPAVAPALPSMWTDKHEAELKFQHDKCHRRKVEAVGDNRLLPQDGDAAALRDEAAKLHEEQVRAERARLGRAARITATLSGQPLATILGAIRGKQVHVSDRCKSMALTNALRSAGLVQCADMSQAVVFIVEKPGSPTAGVRLVSSLKGGYQISPELLLATNQQGSAVKFKPSMLPPRTLFISQRCSRQQRAFCLLVENVLTAAARAECKMKLLISHSDESTPDSEWQALKVRFNKRPSQLLGVVEQSELKNVAFADWKHTFIVTQIVKHLTVVDPAGSLSSLANL